MQRVSVWLRSEIDFEVGRSANLGADPGFLFVPSVISFCLLTQHRPMVIRRPLSHSLYPVLAPLRTPLHWVPISSNDTLVEFLSPLPQIFVLERSDLICWTSSLPASILLSPSHLSGTYQHIGVGDSVSAFL